MTTEHKPHSIQERLVELREAPGRTEWAEIAETLIPDLVEQLEAQRELIEEAYRFALVLAELKVKTRPFAEAWLDKYRAAYPAKNLNLSDELGGF